MAYIRILTASLLFLVILPTIGYTQIVKCVGEVEFLGTRTYEVSVVVADKAQESTLVLADTSDGKRIEFLELLGKPALIEISESGGRSRRFDFVQTGDPGSGTSLIGFFIDRGYPVTLRADLWDEAKPFTVHHTFYKKPILGFCE